MLAVTELAVALSPQMKKYQSANVTTPPFCTALNVAYVEHVEVAGNIVYNVAEASGNVARTAVEVVESRDAVDSAEPVDQDKI